MNKKIFIAIFACLLSLSGLAFFQSAEAAVLYVLPEKRSVAPDESFNVDLKINTEDVYINAAQATVNFPANIIELVEVDNKISAFNFWVEEPLISNDDGTLEFIGGTAKGVSGSALQVLKMTFKAVGTGSAGITISDAVVTASDGKGTNVLSTIEETSIAVSPEIVTPEAPVVPTTLATPVEQPQPVTREPVPAADLPRKPQLKVSLYPDESRWYNHEGEVIVFWDVPDDVVRIATALDGSPNTSPGNIETGLFTGKSFGVLGDGVWYVHVQFRNNVGWGPEAHYRIAVDTTPPIAFEASIDSEVSDSPAPTLFYETHDSLSGIAKAAIYVDGKGPTESTLETTSLVLPLQPPGKHLAKVRFFDKAGNSVEDDLEFEILPLQTPVIGFVTKSVSQDEPVFVSGTALPGVSVDLRVYNKSGQEIDKETAASDPLGNWGLSLEKPLLLGKYTLAATARDERGALSYPSPVEEFTIRPRTIVSLGPIDLGWFEVFVIIILLVVAGVGIYGWYYVGLKGKKEAYAIVVARDVEKMHHLLEENLARLNNNVKKLDNFINPISKEIDPTFKEESLVFIAKMQEVLDKIKKYVKKEVEGLK